MSHERPQPPRPMIESLPIACRTAVQSGTRLLEMNLSRWATTYRCLEADVVREFEKAQWLHTRQPVSEYEGEGK